MFSFMNIVHTALSKIVSLLYTVISVLATGIPSPCEPPKAPEDFEPVVRFAVCSDVHINGEPGQTEAKRLADMINTVYSYSETQAYKGFDALCIAGDMTNSGKEEEYEAFNSVIAENLRAGTSLLLCAGNHEYIAYRDEDASQGARMFEKMMQRQQDAHEVINGYHFIFTSYDENGKSFTQKRAWLKAQLDEAAADTGDKPIFVFQHPAPFSTVYGSVNWGDFTVAELLSRYPQAVNFSGHSHYPINDPRSVWQGTFTALGCGTLSHFETELDCIAGQFPYQSEKAAQFYIAEADAAGNVRVLSYDLITHQFFDNEYYLTGLADKNYPYAYAKMKAYDGKPCFPEETSVSTHVNENGETILTFTGAKDKLVTESYKVSVTKNGIKAAEDNFSSKYMYLFEDDVYSVNLGTLEIGKKYNVQIVAMNAYANLSDALRYTFTAE